MNARFENVPNRDRAMTNGHRSVAQKGQYSAPMYRTSGLASCVSGAPVSFVGEAATEPDPIGAAVLSGTDVTVWMMPAAS